MSGKMRVMNPKYLGPIKMSLKGAKGMLECIEPEDKHWLCNGKRAVAVAANLLEKHEIIAVPTDTIYGLAAVMNDNIAIEHMYRIKKRDRNKPIAICLNSISEIPKYGIVDDLPRNTLINLLPGKITIILKRTKAVNSALNPGIDNIGIRVPNCDFITGVAKIVGPLALTSANISNQPSCLKPDEFSELWPELGGIFHDPINKTVTEESRVGSTVVDLSQPGRFTIKRRGMSYKMVENYLRHCGLIQCQDE